MAHSDESASLPPLGDELHEPAEISYPEQSQIDFDLAFFDRLLEREPNYIDALRCQGELLTRKGLSQRALEIDRRLVALLPADAAVYYNLACSLARMREEPKAIQALSRALTLGFSDLEALEADPDLESIRHAPEYQALLAEYRQRFRD